MKKCNICNKDFTQKQKTEKYCSGKCAEQGAKNKAKERYNNKDGLVKSKCICCNGKGFVFQNYANTQQELKNKIMQLYKKGLGIREIQRELKIRSPFTITYYLRKANEKQLPKLELIPPINTK
jgi:transposase-like protein